MPSTTNGMERPPRSPTSTKNSIRSPSPGIPRPKSSKKIKNGSNARGLSAEGEISVKGMSDSTGNIIRRYNGKHKNSAVDNEGKSSGLDRLGESGSSITATLEDSELGSVQGVIIAEPVLSESRKNSASEENYAPTSLSSVLSHQQQSHEEEDWRGEFANSVEPYNPNIEACLPTKVATEDDARFHNCIKDHDWEKLEKLLKQFDVKYYKKKRKQAKELMETEQFQQGQADNNFEGDEERENESPVTPRKRFLASFSSFSSRRQQSPNDNKWSKTSNDTPKGGLAKKILPKSMADRMYADPMEVVSPLLMVDDMGRTPLHLACIHKAPEAMILDILSKEKIAAYIQDLTGQVPLHCAVKTWQYDHILEKVVKAYPHALKTKDIQGRTPIGLSVQLARQRQEDETPEEDPNHPSLWIHASSKKERRWQFEQEKNWSKVNALLKDLMKRNKSVIPSEHGLILEALEGGADPNTINRLISTGDRYLVSDDELAGTAIGLCVERHYVLDTLEYLMENCNEKTTIITDAVYKALRTHYRQGCHPLRDGMAPFGKQIIDWTKKQQAAKSQSLQVIAQRAKKKEHQKKKKQNNSQNQKSIDSEQFYGIDDNESFIEDEEASDEEKEEKASDDEWSGMDKSCKEWWEILNYLIFYCAFGRNFKESTKPKSYHLLHAALSIPVVPPSLIQLLSIVFPEARTVICPLYKALPIHIACTRWRYDIIRSENDASLDRVLKIMLKEDSDLVFRRHKGRLPIHLALSVGQTWTFLKAFVSVDKKCVGMRDPQSRFFPFQMAALPASSKNLQLLMRSQFTPTEWRIMSTAEKKLEYKKVEIEQDRRQTGTIFELLRRHPDAVQGMPLYRVSTVTSRSLRAAGKVAIHYLSFVYGKNSKGGYRIRSDNARMLRDAVMRADIPPELERWWDDMKRTIWDEFHGDIPQEDEYILHAALYNPETPPLLIELLLELYPSSVSKPVPGTTIYPLHIAAGTTAYHRHPFEMPYGMDNLHLVLAADKRVTRCRLNGRLPIHICLARGKSWKEVRALVKADPSTLMAEDKQTDLMPFQLIASFKLTSRENALRYSAFVEKQTRNVDIYRLSVKDKAMALSRIHKKQELNQLTCIFELLRHRPSAMARRPPGYAGSDSLSLLSLLGTSLGSGGEDSPSRRGNAVGLNQLLMQASTTRSASVRDLMTSSPKKSASLITFFNKNDVGTTPGLITPGEMKTNRTSLSSFLASAGNSTRSLISRDGSGVYNSYSKPTYDDDATSLVGSLQSAAQTADNSTSSPTSAWKLRRGKRPSKVPFNLPNLED